MSELPPLIRRMRSEALTRLQILTAEIRIKEMRDELRQLHQEGLPFTAKLVQQRIDELEKVVRELRGLVGAI